MKKLMWILIFLLILIAAYTAGQYIQKTDLSPAKDGDSIVGSIAEWTNENLGTGKMNRNDLRRTQNMEKEMKNQIEISGESR